MPNADNIADRKLIEIARAKLDRQLALDWDERCALNCDLALKEGAEILAMMDEVRNKNDRPVLYSQGAHNAARLAIKLMVGSMYSIAAAQADKRQAIEAENHELRKRIIALEEKSPSVQGTFDPKKTYRALDVVALNGASFTARRDNPGPCPGAGWQLSAAQGKSGKPGPRVKSLTVDGQGMITLTNADGSTVKCDLYPVLNKVQRA